MATFDEFYASLDPDIRIKGKQFEKFVKWFLKTDPTWATQIDEIWLWNEYPKRWGADCGIDLIFTHKNGKTWAVQSKCISPNNDIKKSEIDSFLSESNDSKIDGRLLIASTDGIGKNAQQVINRQEKQVVCFLLEQFRQSAIKYPSSIEDINTGKRKEKKNPRPHQIEAIEKVSQGLKNADRGQVLMACGTGKTLTSLWIKEKLGAKQVLVLVPSLSLLSQTLKEWNAEANEPFKWICVCSDKSVAKDKSEDQWISNTSEIGVPVTSETLELKHFLDESGSKVVFATYQSSQLIVEAQEHHDTSDFDLVIADEAHRCAGKVSNAFGSVLDENKIKASKILFFTATPRIISRQLKTKSLDMDFEVASMDDHLVFGEVLYQLKFSEAIKRDLLSDYQVVVIGVDDEIIKQKIINRELIKVDDETILDAETIASQVAISKAIKDYDLKRIITFHSKIKNAKDFSKTFDQVIKYIDDSDLPSGFLNCEHISGVMKTSERNLKLYELKNLKVNERRILTNARCLSEGVDVPTLSGIAFINPKQSQIDIIQAVGRAIRQSADKTKGTIIIPLYISKKETLDEALLNSNFKKVWQIIIALKSQDDSLNNCIDRLRIKKGKQGNIDGVEWELDRIIFDIPQRITEKLTKSIQAVLVENASEGWFERYGELLNFHEKEGHTNVNTDSPLGQWCSRQRTLFRRNNLLEEKVKLLQDIKFTWDPSQEQWQNYFNELQNFYEREGHSDIPANSSSLGRWCSTQRKLYRQHKLNQQQVYQLERIKFSWDPFEEQWQNYFDELQNFYEREGHSSPNVKTSELGAWSGRQRHLYNIKKLSEKKINLFNSIEFVWDPIQTQWNEKYQELLGFYEKDGNIPPPQGTSLNEWCRKQRNMYRNKKLSKEKIELLERINFAWDPLQEQWELTFAKLKNNFLSKGIAISDDDSKSLKQWCTCQRRLYKNKKLSKEKIDLFNSIKFVWDPIQEEWEKNYKILVDFYKKFGHTKASSDKDNIGNWVRTQKTAYKRGSMSQERIKLLNDINFVWKDESDPWKDNFTKLKFFYEKNGHTNISSKDSSLGAWSRQQRDYYKKKKLSKEKIELLESINFVWDYLEKQWNDTFYLLKEFYKREGHAKPSRKIYPSLESWCKNQRKAYRENKLSQDKYLLLQSINFQWEFKK